MKLFLIGFLETFQNLYYKQIKKRNMLSQLVGEYEDAPEGAECRTYAYLMRTAKLKLERRQHQYVREQVQAALGGKVSKALAATNAEADTDAEGGTEAVAAQTTTKGKGDGKGGKPAGMKPELWNQICNAYAEKKCMNFQKGTCTRGSNCSYEHTLASTKDLGNPGPGPGKGTG